MIKNLRNILVVSSSTVGSRVLGLVRDIMIFAVLGTSLWNSAFILAFTLPNLFRRLLGEGALSSAVVPVFSDVLKSKGKENAFEFFNQVLLRVSVILLATVTGGVVILAILNGAGWLEGRWMLGADLSVILLPYMIFICLAAVISAGLNVLGRFAAASLTPVLLNLSMIAALSVAWMMNPSEKGVVYLLCGGVLFGGLLQLALPTWDFFRQGWRPKIITQSSESLEEVWSLFLPGLMGAAILQVNILVSRLLAFTLDESSVSVLYLASRLMELPLGVFTFAIITVFFPLLASASSDKDKVGFATSFNQAVRLIIAITIPAGVGLVLLADPILGLLFNWGNFTSEDVKLTVPLLIIYSVGLPFYSMATFATRGYHARKDMVSPVRIALVCLITNAVASYVLMQFIGVVGLAIANVFAAMLQSTLLWSGLSNSVQGICIRNLYGSLLKVLGSAAVMALAVLFTVQVCNQLVSIQNEKIMHAILVISGISAGVGSYFAVLMLVKFEEFDRLKSLILNKFSAK